MVADGKIGEPQIIRITSRDPAPPPVSYVKVSGSMFLDMTIHDFDMARYLSGSEMVEVCAAAGVMVDPGIGEAGDVDTAVITLYLPMAPSAPSITAAKQSMATSNVWKSSAPKA